MSPEPRQQGFFPMSLRNKLFFLRIGISLVSGLVIGLACVWIAAAVLYHFLGKSLAVSARLTSSQIELSVARIGQDLSELARSEEAEKYYHTARASILRRLFEDHGRGFDKITYINAEGRAGVMVFPNAPESSARPSGIDDPDGVANALNRPNRLLVEGPVFDPDLRQPVIRFYYFGIDYFDNPIGLFQGAITLARFRQQMESLFQGEDRFNLMILNQEDRIVYGPEDTDLGGPGAQVLGDGLLAEPGSGYLGSHPVKGSDTLVAVHPMSDPAWQIYVVKSQASVHKPLYIFFSLVFLVVVTVLAAGEAFARQLGINITEPIQRLTRAASEILKSGNPDQRVTWDAKDELGQLAGLFNAMLDRIDTKQQRLQARRTLELEQEVARRKEDQERLRTAIIEAEAATRAKSEFLANMSHEIRTPMNGIIGMAELAMDTPLDKSQRDLIATISSEAESLMAIINSILDFSKIEAGKLELEKIPFNLRELLDELSGTFGISAQKKGLELITYMPPDMDEQLVGDPGRLRQVLVNMVGNALKFTHKGEVYIRIDRDADRDGDRRLRFTIRDTGIGISPEDQKKIFDSFSQADGSTTRRYGGTGLGITISKQLVEMMGGTMRVESCLGEGATFWFTAAFGAAPGRSGTRPCTVLPQGMKVLVVDDNENNRFVLSRYLSSFGCRPVLAEDAAGALALLSEQVAADPFRIILCDYQMPRMSGLELAQKIKDLPGSGQAPLILLSSVGSLVAPGSAAANGVFASLSKPIRKYELKQALLSALDHKEAAAPSGSWPEPEPPGHPEPKHGKQGKIRILLAEDYPTNQQIAIKHLTGSGFQVKLAEDGVQALDLFSQGGFDLVLMDIQMPDLDGYEATRMIREQERRMGLGRIPIIAMTAHAIKGYREKCLAAGMDDYLTKPLKRWDLIQLVERWAGRTPGSGQQAQPRQMDLFDMKASPLDLATALAEFDGDRPFLKEVVLDFLDNLKSQVPVIESAAREKDYTAARQQAHAVKGGAGNLRAGEMAAAAGDLEAACSLGRDHQIREALARLKAAAKELEQFAGTM